MSDAPSRKVRYIANAATLLFAVAVIAAAAEIFVRAVEDDGMQFDLEMWKYAKSVKRISSDPLIGHEHRPNADAHLMGVRVTTNEAGFRDEPAPLEKPPGRLRIMMLGDSITFGWGADQEQTVSALLKRAWRAAGRNVDVINTGVGNYNTVMQVQFFLKNGYRFKPDVAILNYFINDAEPVPRYDYSWLERISAAYVFYGSRLDAIKRTAGLGEQTDWKRYYEGLYDEARNPGGWRAAEQAIRKLAAHARDNGIRLLIVNYPEIRELKPYPFAAVNRRLEALAKELGVPYLDLLGSVAGEDPASLWVTRPDPHPNNKAHRLFAEAIRQWVEREKLLP